MKGDSNDAPDNCEQWFDVAVNSGQPSRTAFTYRAPQGLQVSAGQAVFVPFGPRVLQGIVLEERSRPELEGIRDIEALADEMMGVIIETANDYVMAGAMKGVEIIASKLGDSAGITGAAVLARRQTK